VLEKTQALCDKVKMNRDWATENLQVIRTLMERSALYRRALAPVMILSGGMGVVGCVLGFVMPIRDPVVFVIFWMSLGLLTLALALCLARKQAIQLKEPFWSPPAKRVFKAMAPLLFAGWAIAAILANSSRNPLHPMFSDPLLLFVWTPAFWAIFYGGAVYSAGFYTRRGIQLFGTLMMLSGLCVLVWPWQNVNSGTGHLVMGALFAATHILYGFYLASTERALPAS